MSFTMPTGELYIVFAAMTGRAVSGIAHASSSNGFRRKAKRVAFQNSGANRGCFPVGRIVQGPTLAGRSAVHLALRRSSPSLGMSSYNSAI
jgi:hypothetical protein